MATLLPEHVAGDRSSSVPHSPSPTRSGRRSRHKKGGSDPFLDLPDDLSAATLVDGEKDDSPPGQPDQHSRNTQSLFDEFVLTPLNLIATVLSLFLVDYNQRQWRVSQHAGAPDSFWHRLFHSQPEPYQEPQDATWQRSSGADGGTAPSPVPGAAAVARQDASYRGWFRRKKHRAMAKLEINDALEIRKTVMAGLIVWMSVVLFALAYGFQASYGWVMKRYYD